MENIEKKNPRRRSRQEREVELTESMLDFYREVPEIYKGVFAKAYVEKGYAPKVKAKCLDCCCFQKDEIRNCTCESCPLWTARPYK